MGGIRHWGTVELHGLRSLTCTPRTGKGESRARRLHLLRPKGIFPSSCIKGIIILCRAGSCLPPTSAPRGFCSARRYREDFKVTPKEALLLPTQRQEGDQSVNEQAVNEEDQQ